jgi:hypothetical protein
MATRRILVAVLVFSALLASDASGDSRIVSMQVYRSEDWLECRLRAADLLDARVTSTVESGLPGALLYRIDLLDEHARTVARRIVELRLHLDVWNEIYWLESRSKRQAFHSISQADSAWSQPPPIRLAPLRQLLPQLGYRLQVELAISPLGHDEKAWISGYVSQASGSGTEEFSIDVGGLLGRFFRRKSEQDEKAGRWRGDLFRLEELEASP